MPEKENHAAELNGTATPELQPDPSEFFMSFFTIPYVFSFRFDMCFKILLENSRNSRVGDRHEP